MSIYVKIFLILFGISILVATPLVIHEHIQTNNYHKIETKYNLFSKKNDSILSGSIDGTKCIVNIKDKDNFGNSISNFISEINNANINNKYKIVLKNKIQSLETKLGKSFTCKNICSKKSATYNVKTNKCDINTDPDKPKCPPITKPTKPPIIPVCSVANSKAADNICRTVFSKDSCKATYCNIGVDKTGQCKGLDMGEVTIGGKTFTKCCT
jgi:hypothetical protein|tara:strand:- start:1048 stop:1683 length:636 start_codon:yes stop_codon:yes gene_type:complete